MVKTIKHWFKSQGRITGIAHWNGRIITTSAVVSIDFYPGRGTILRTESGSTYRLINEIDGSPKAIKHSWAPYLKKHNY